MDELVDVADSSSDAELAEELWFSVLEVFQADEALEVQDPERRRLLSLQA